MAIINRFMNAHAGTFAVLSVAFSMAVYFAAFWLFAAIC